MSATRITGLALATALALAGAPALAQDDPRAVPLFNARHGLADILAVAMTRKKALVVVLSNGSTYVGRIKAVGDHAVVVTEIQGKEFFDAYIPLDDIVALEERVRMR